MKILITGGAGYVGSALARKLLEGGHEVAILEKFRFGEESIEDIKDKVTIIHGDLVKMSHQEMIDYPLLGSTDAVIHLAAMSKEPSSAYNNSYALELNYFVTKRLADACKEAGTKFIYASSSSVYFSYDLPEIPNVGKQYWKLNKELPFRKEDDPLNCISPYSITKRASEEYLLSIADDKFKPVMLRKGTIYGLSPRMRFDLVVNALTKTAFFDKKMTVLKGIYRPLVDLKTVLMAYSHALTLDSTEIINISDFNTSLEELAARIDKILPVDSEIIVKDVKVERNYRASDEKMKQFGFEQTDDFDKSVMKVWNFLKENPQDKPIYYNASQ